MSVTDFTETQDFAATETGLARVIKGWVVAYNARSAKDTAAFFADDAILYPQNAEPAKGKAAIEGVMKHVFGLGQMEFTFTPIASSISGDFAYQTGAYVQTITPATGAPIEDRGEAIIIMKRVAGDEWRIIHDMYNSDLPAA